MRCVDVDDQAIERLLELVPDLDAPAEALCSSCTARPAKATTGVCGPCGRDSAGITSIDRDERARARKRRWWAEHGKQWRAERARAAVASAA